MPTRSECRNNYLDHCARFSTIPHQELQYGPLASPSRKSCGPCATPPPSKECCPPDLARAQVGEAVLRWRCSAQRGLMDLAASRRCVYLPRCVWCAASGRCLCGAPSPRELAGGWPTCPTPRGKTLLGVQELPRGGQELPRGVKTELAGGPRITSG